MMELFRGYGKPVISVPLEISALPPITQINSLAQIFADLNDWRDIGEVRNIAHHFLAVFLHHLMQNIHAFDFKDCHDLIWRRRGRCVGEPRWECRWRLPVIPVGHLGPTPP